MRYSVILHSSSRKPIFDNCHILRLLIIILVSEGCEKDQRKKLKQVKRRRTSRKIGVLIGVSLHLYVLYYSIEIY